MWRRWEGDETRKRGRDVKKKREMWRRGEGNKGETREMEERRDPKEKRGKRKEE